MKYTFLFILLICCSKLCNGQIKGIAKVPYTGWDYSNPIKSTSKLDSIIGHKEVYYELKSDTIKFKYQVDTLKGKLNGVCKIWNIDNQLLIKGRFKDNQKTGKWSYFYNDKSNRIVRKFNTNYSFVETKLKREFLKYPTTKQLSKKFIEYPQINEDSILYSKISWRFIPKNSHNQHLFENDKLWNDFKYFISKNTNSIIYKTSWFDKQLPKAELLSFINSNDIEILGFKIKEFYYFHKSYSNSESRILGICPVIKDKTKTKDLFWFFYSDIRQLLANIPSEVNNQISTLEDVFHYKYFNSFIYHSEHISKIEQDVNLLDKKNRKILIENSIITEMDNLYLERKKIN